MHKIRYKFRYFWPLAYEVHFGNDKDKDTVTMEYFFLSYAQSAGVS